MEYLLYILLGLALGIVLAVGLIWVYIQGLVREIIGDIDEKIKENSVGIVAEIDNGVIYCYTEKERTFVAQGTDVGIIRDTIRNRYPGKIAYLAGGDVEAVTRLQAGLSELAKEAE